MAEGGAPSTMMEDDLIVIPDDPEEEELGHAGKINQHQAVHHQQLIKEAVQDLKW